jgi:hypothetical protein
MRLSAHKPAAAVCVGADAMSWGVTFACSVAFDGAIDVYIGNNWKATLKGGHHFWWRFQGSCFSEDAKRREARALE